MSDPSAPAGPKDLDVQAALQAYLGRVDRGEIVDREKFLLQHSEIAGKLRSFIVAEEQLRRLAGAERANERIDTSTQSIALHDHETIEPLARAKRAAATGEGGLKQGFGRYRIVKALGKGAMGMVYLADDTQLQRQVAIKTRHFEQEATPELLERFYREARAAATLRHPNICPIHDVGQIEGTHYISMAYIDGHPLSAFIRSAKPQPERSVAIVIRKLAQALQEAHDHGVVHRDLKPANIMVDKRGEPIIMDFGLARNVQCDEDVQLTKTGVVVGTPAFMSPEQIEGNPDKIGPATDQYSLGVILYELLTGQLPFRGTLLAVMGQVVTREPTPPSQLRSDVDRRLETVCLKMMAKNPYDRFPGLAAVADALTTILKNSVAKKTPTATMSAVRVRDKADEFAFLIREIDETDRTRGERTVVKKGENLLKSRPADSATPDIQEKLAGRRAARTGPLSQFTRPWNEGGWIPWSVLGFGLAFFAVMLGMLVIPLGKTAIVIDIRDPDVVVTVKGKHLTITGTQMQTVEVHPGEQELTINYAGLETRTKRFELQSGQKRIVTVWIAGKEIVAKLDRESLPSVADSEKNEPKKAQVDQESAPKSPEQPTPAQEKLSVATPNRPPSTAPPGGQVAPSGGRDEPKQATVSAPTNPASGSPKNTTLRSGSGEPQTASVAVPNRHVNVEYPVTGDKSPGVERLDAIMLKCLKNSDCTGATLAVGRGRHLLYSRGYGWSDRDRTVPIRPDTPMYIANSDEPFTRAAIRQLADKGKLDLNAPVLELLKIKPAGNVVDQRVFEITINHLLDNKAGWEGKEGIELAQQAAASQGRSPIEAETLLSYVMCRKLIRAPGAKEEFDWLGNDTLKRVVAHISGQRYIDYLRYELCRRRGIKELRWIRDAGTIRKGEPAPPWNGLVTDEPEEYRMAVSTPAMCTFMRFFWLDGTPRDNDSQFWTWDWYNSNSTTGMFWRTDGINVVWCFNGKLDPAPGKELWSDAIDGLKEEHRLPR